MRQAPSAGQGPLPSSNLGADWGPQQAIPLSRSKDTQASIFEVMIEQTVLMFAIQTACLTWLFTPFRALCLLASFAMEIR